MAKHVRVEDLTEDSGEAQPSWTDMLDPAARQARVEAARERRARIFAERAAEGAEMGDAPPVASPRPPRIPTDAPQAAIQWDPEPPRRPIAPEADVPLGTGMATKIATMRAGATPRPVAKPVEPKAVAGGALAPTRPAPGVQASEAVRPASDRVILDPVAPLVAEPRISPARGAGRGDRSLLLTVIFLVGLMGGGAAALLAPLSMRQRIADMIAPPAPRVTSVTVDMPLSAPAPMTEPPAAPGALTEKTPPTSPGNAAPSSSETVPAPLERPADLGARAVPVPATPLDAPAELGDISPVPKLTAPAPSTGQGEALAAPDLPRIVPMTGVTGDLSVLAGLPSPPEAAKPEAAKPEATKAAPMDLGMARVVVHFPPSAAGSAGTALEALRTAGVSEATSLPARFSVANANVRYYHAEDREAAQAIAAIVGGAGDVPEARDFTNFRPKPNLGMIEVWLSGEAPAGKATTPVAVSAAPPVAAAQTQTRAPSPAQDSEAVAVERILLERRIEQMLRSRLPAN